MMNQQHINNQLADYALGLLSQSERRRVERHTAVCADCRGALRRETAVASAARGTLAVAAQPPANLRAFMPAIPQRPKRGLSLIWRRQLAPIALFLILLLGGAGFYLSGQQGVWTNPSPTFLAVTATMTDEPTATLTQTRVEESVEAAQTAVPAAPSQPQINATPAPNPTPIAALPVKMTSN
ncbi:MAG: hypothetical protein GY803_29385 [Chloroflexi bacterium]|nr:hypothetical protein [Chloroflexota bacterium]